MRRSWNVFRVRVKVEQVANSDQPFTIIRMQWGMNKNRDTTDARLGGYEFHTVKYSHLDAFDSRLGVRLAIRKGLAWLGRSDARIIERALMKQLWVEFAFPGDTAEVRFIERLIWK